MRFICLLLLFSVGVACGSGTHQGSDPRPGFFTFVPSISALSPTSSPANSPSFSMTVMGSNFGPDSVVFWNGLAQQTTFLSPDQLLVAVTDADLMTAGLTHVFVRTGGMNTNTIDFNVTPQ